MPRYALSQSATVRLLLALAAVSFLFTLRAQYMGEEGVYSTLSLEMHQRGSLLGPTLQGVAYGRPPLLNWLIDPVASLLGWPHVREAARLVALLVTLATAGVTAWVARLCGLSRAGAELAALLFLTMAYSLFWYGWLSYSDGCFGLFVLLSVGAGLAAVSQKRYAWLLLAVLALAAGFLTKALTVYVFYGTAMLVLAVREKAWRFLLDGRSLLVHALALAFPWIWMILNHHTAAQGSSMLSDILMRMHEQHGQHYAAEVLGFLADGWKMLLPLSAILPVMVFRTRRERSLGLVQQTAPRIRSLLWIALLGAVPYAVFPGGNVRYVYPLTGIMAVVFAALIGTGGARFARVAIAAAAALIALRVVLALTWLPAYQARHRDFTGVARDVQAIVGRTPLYIDDTDFVGDDVGAELDALRWPAPVLHVPDAYSQGFLLAASPRPSWSRVIKRYRISDNDLYLLCRGAACP
jgi:4-amino-4-deoxy-L-arabinose transferase-like glycosyltransferase